MKRAVFTALVVSLLCASVAMADPPGGRKNGHGWRDHPSERRWSNDRRDHKYDGRRDDRREHRRGPDRRYDHDRKYQPHYNDWGRHDHRPGHRVPPGLRNHYWRRGDRLPRVYYAPRYVIRDYRTYRLRPPPRGCHWVRVNNDLLLTAIATGIVLDVMHGHFH